MKLKASRATQSPFAAGDATPLMQSSVYSAAAAAQPGLSRPLGTTVCNISRILREIFLFSRVALYSFSMVHQLRTPTQYQDVQLVLRDEEFQSSYTQVVQISGRYAPPVVRSHVLSRLSWSSRRVSSRSHCVRGGAAILSSERTRTCFDSHEVHFELTLGSVLIAGIF